MAERKRRLTVAVVGAANLDLSATAAQAWVAGDSVVGRIDSAPGGVARNIAENLARMGQRCSLFSVVGADATGRQLLRATAAAGVDVASSSALRGQRSSSYLSLHAANGTLCWALNDMDALLARLDAAWLQRRRASLARAALWVLEANLHDEALAWLFAHAGPRRVFADAVSASKCLRLRPWLPRIHTLKLNLLEARALCALAADAAAPPRALCRRLHRLGLQQVALSLGAQGLMLSRADGEVLRDKPLPVAVANTSGAGDALLAGLVHAHVQGWPLARALAFANACAALTVGARGPNFAGLTQAAVDALLAQAAAGTIES